MHTVRCDNCHRELGITSRTPLEIELNYCNDACLKKHGVLSYDEAELYGELNGTAPDRG